MLSTGKEKGFLLVMLNKMSTEIADGRFIHGGLVIQVCKSSWEKIRRNACSFLFFSIVEEVQTRWY